MKNKMKLPTKKILQVEEISDIKDFGIFDNQIKDNDKQMSNKQIIGNLIDRSEHKSHTPIKKNKTYNSNIYKEKEKEGKKGKEAIYIYYDDGVNIPKRTDYIKPFFKELNK